MAEIIDKIADKCKRCGGKCCELYSPETFSKYQSVWFEEYVESWLESFEESGATKTGIKPQFDPLEVHMGGNEHMMWELVQKGIDPDSCQYRGQKGCLLPRDKRPQVCREYICDREIK